MTKVPGAWTDSCTLSLDGGPETHTLQVALRIGGHENASADLAERRRLFRNRHAQSLRNQRIGGEQATNAASNDHNAGPRRHNRRLRKVSNATSCEAAE